MIFDPLIFDSTIFDTGEAAARPNLAARRRRIYRQRGILDYPPRTKPSGD